MAAERIICLGSSMVAPVITIMNMSPAYAVSVNMLANASLKHTIQCPVMANAARAIIFMKNPPNGGRPLRLRRTAITDVLEWGELLEKRPRRLADAARKG